MVIRPFLSRRQLALACMRQLGSLYGASWEAMEERVIRSELRRMGIPVDPVLSEPRVLEEDYWAPTADDTRARQEREERLAKPRRYRRRNSRNY